MASLYPTRSFGCIMLYQHFVDEISSCLPLVIPGPAGKGAPAAKAKGEGKKVGHVAVENHWPEKGLCFGGKKHLKKQHDISHPY